MPGYYVHLASTNEEALENREFVWGLEAPDLLKAYYKRLGLEGTREKYNLAKTGLMPAFDKLAKRVTQKESILSSDGLHYGVSSKPNIMKFWNSLSEEEKKNPYYRGYLWHLLTDLLMYTYLDIDKKLQEKLKNYVNEGNFDEYKMREVSILHADWDKINHKIKELYPNVVLTDEIKDLNVVKFLDDDNTIYIEFELIKTLIDFLRLFNPLGEDIDNNIKDIISLSKNKENLKEIKRILNRRTNES